ncbi:MAG: hypothetical protein RML46_00355 [Anaerolineae bacterium]|nr:hypothetical protein [Anaerolineae bacterium]
MPRSKRVLLGIAALLAGMLGALAFSGALAAPRAAFLHIATNLSGSPNRFSYYADIAVSPDGDRVVVAWSEAYQDGGGAMKGSVYLRWASERTGGWSARVPVHTGTSSECARWAAVAVTGTNPYTAVVAYITQSPCDQFTSQAVRYRVCPLGGTCGPVQTVVYTTHLSGSQSEPGYGAVDVALDGAGQPHFAYTYYRRDLSQGKDVGTVYYRSPNIPAETVSENQNARLPAIAWNGGAVHVVWATEPTSEDGYYSIFYRRRTTSGWAPSSRLLQQDLGYAPHSPAIAVFSSTVLVAWDMNNAWTDEGCSTAQEQCERYTLAYIRSTNNGDQWPQDSTWGFRWYELGGGFQGTDRPYTSTGAVAEYIRFLRPSVGFRADGKPVVVWHANDGTTDNPDYNIYYTEALTVPENAEEAIEWGEIRRFGLNAPRHSASPAVAPFLSGEALHVVYIQGVPNASGQVTDWETYYDGNEDQKCSRVYLPVVLRNFR